MGQALFRLILGLIGLREKKVIEIYKNTISDIQNIILVYEKKGIFSLDAMKKYKRFNNLEDSIRASLIAMMLGLNKTVYDASLASFLLTYYKVGWLIEKEINKALSYKALNKKTLEKVLTDEVAGFTFKERNTNARLVLQKKLREELYTGLKQKEGFGKLANRVSKRLKIDQTRALTMVRTECGRAHSLGEIASVDHARSKGVKVVRIWDAAEDNHTRAIKRKLDKKEENKNGEWVVDGYTTKGPRLFGVAEFDINCRCYTRRRIIGDNVVSYEAYNKQSFSQWLKEIGIEIKL